MEWIRVNAATIVVSAALLLAAGAAIRYIYKAKKSGGCVGCSGCGGSLDGSGEGCGSHCGHCPSRCETAEAGGLLTPENVSEKIKK